MAALASISSAHASYTPRDVVTARKLRENPTFMSADIQIIVGARQIRNAVAVEQPRVIAARDFAEVLDRNAQAACTVTMAGHGAHQSIEPALHHGGVLGVMVVQDMGGFVHPRIGLFNVRPQDRGLRQAALDQTLQACERRQGPPFSATRSALAATFSSRCLSFSPLAANGAWRALSMAHLPLPI